VGKKAWLAIEEGKGEMEGESVCLLLAELEALDMVPEHR
jgi:hypothetical protein